MTSVPALPITSRATVGEVANVSDIFVGDVFLKNHLGFDALAIKN
jgi:hypothetical protein